MKPLVSVVMPAYNAEKYIEAAIRSVQVQTMPDWELIVIDDGSTDATCEIVARLAAEDARIYFLKNSENMGTARTRNRGLDLSRGKYVALLDSDDVWYPEKLERQKNLLEEEHADLVYCSYAIIDENGMKKCRDFIVPESITLSALLKKSVISCSTAFYTRETAIQHPFVLDYYHEDYVCWLSMIKSGKKAVGTSDVLAAYRLHEKSRAFNKIASAKRRWHVYRSYMKLPIVKCLYFSACYAINGSMKYMKKGTNAV